METIRNLPTREIFAIMMPTMKAFIPGLLANKEQIKSIKPTTHTYGPHPRHQLDIYQSSTPNSPLFVFLYGGGLTRGDKILGAVPEGLAYHNMGTFFALQGFTTVIADYRRVNDAQAGTGEDATFPSGGDDLSLVLEFLGKQEGGSGGKPRDIFVMGNSAGGVHTATFLFHEKFRAQREVLQKGESGLKFKGAILLSIPFDQDSAAASRAVVNEQYWPVSLTNDEKAKSKGHSEHEFGPSGLLRRAKATSVGDLAIPTVLVAEDEFDPEDDIVGAINRFFAAWNEKFGSEEGVEKLFVAGHNHISPTVALLSGDPAAEKWGVDVSEWCKKQL